MTSEITEFGGLIVVAVLVAAFARNRGVNPSLPLLGAGLIFGLLPIGPDAPADPEFVLVVVLAPLVFGEALSSSIVDLRTVSRPVMALAIGLVIVGAFVVGGVAALLLPGVPLTACLCLGAILGPTDAVAVSATARSVALPRRLVNILEGESLVNDGTALTLLRVFSVAAAAGSVAVGEVSLILVESVALGLLVGALAGWLLALLTARARDTTVANGVILIAPFPIYAAAERVEGSGILAVVVAALILAHATSSTATYAGRLQATSLWRAVIFILQAVAFFLVGIDVPDALRQLTPDEHRQLLIVVPVVVIALIATRFVFVYGMTTIAGTRREYRRGWIVLAWAGTRGPISALAAFTLPLTTSAGAEFPARSLIISITFCVVVVSLLLAPTMGPLARRCDLPPDDDSRTVQRVRLALAHASLERLDEMVAAADRAGTPLPPTTVTSLRTAVDIRVERLEESEVEDEQTDDDAPLTTSELRLSMVHAEQEELLRLRDEEGLPDALMRSIQKELDLRAKAVQVG
ncbi:MAG: cation:proton antiporter [Candidatus Nanopelagicales bacterium]